MPEHHVLAALAEAWHVDRCYEPAAKAWEMLATAGPDPDEAALKAAISWYAHGDIQRGNDWLAQARAQGVAPAEWRYVHAQRLWAERAWERAIDEFRAAAAEDPRSGRALNALGSLLWKVGRSSDARALVHEALQRDPHDPCALANRVSMDLEEIDLEEGHELLTRAATALERIEPFVLAARLLRRRQLEADARAALAKARLRDRWLGPIGPPPAPAGATLRAHVTGELTAGPSLEVTLHRLDAGAVRFAEVDGWLAEALAEYTRHLAEDAGVIDHARTTLELVERSCDAALIAEPLTRLWRSSPVDDADARRRALVLRVKGGYMIRALRTVLGDDRFRAFLRLLCAAGDRQPLHGYTFFALASQIHGASLTWFANQWAHVPAAIVLEADVDRVESIRGGHRIEFLARARGAMTLGAPIDIEVRCADGSTARTSAALDVGPRRLTMTTPTCPVAVVLDPERRWYATRRTVQLEPA